MRIILILLSLLGSGYALDMSSMGSFAKYSKIIEDEKVLLEGGVNQTVFQRQDGTVVLGRQDSVCYNVSDSMFTAMFTGEKKNNFLDMMNFMEYVQTTGTQFNKDEDAIKFFNVSVAAMEAGNTFVSQENVARALSTIEVVKNRKKRDSSGMRVRYSNVAANGDTWDASNLFADFRERLGDEQLKDLLHLNKRVTMAFVIDTSSSMENDMGQVRKYIDQLLDEQREAGVSATYIVTTFADPLVGKPIVYNDAQTLRGALARLRSRIGGDCEERTCYGMLRAIASSNFARYRNAAMFVFTDAGSKDCGSQGGTIIKTLTLMRASAYFILFDSCKPNIDNDYVKIAQKTGGFCILIKENGVYNITDTVNGAFENDALIFGEQSDTANSVVGQGVRAYRKKRSEGYSYEEEQEYYITKDILIDTSIEKFRVQAQIKPVSLQSEISLIKPDTNVSDCADSNLDIIRSEGDDTVVLDVYYNRCPCTGHWTLQYPRKAESFSYAIKSAGEFLVSFESYFVDEVEYNRIANYAPCLGKEEYLVIKLNQGEKVNIDTLTAKIIAVAGNQVRWVGKLAKDALYANTFVVNLTIPIDIGTDGFRVMLEGEIVDGTKFQRISTAYFYPTASCFRVVSVDNYYALFPNKKTYIEIEITNNDQIDEAYSIICSNTENYDVFIGAAQLKAQEKKKRARFSNPMYLRSGEALNFKVSISAPRSLKNGRTVTVICKASTTTGDLIELIRLTEMRTRL